MEEAFTEALVAMELAGTFRFCRTVDRGIAGILC